MDELVQDTTTLEFGEFSAYKLNSKQIKSNIFLPKYYDPEITKTLSALSVSCDLHSVGDLEKMGILKCLQETKLERWHMVRETYHC